MGDQMESRHAEFREEKTRVIDDVSGPLSARLGRLVEIATTATRAPVAFVSIVDGDRIRYRQSIGLEVETIPLDQTICARVMEFDAPTVSRDPGNDPRFSDLEIVQDGEFGLYAGVPVHDSTGGVIGVMGVCDRATRGLEEHQIQTLEQLAVLVGEILETEASGEFSALRPPSGKTVYECLSKPSSYEQIFRNSADPMVITDLEGRLMDANRQALSLLGRNLVEIRDLNLRDFLLDDEDTVDVLFAQSPATKSVAIRAHLTRPRGGTLPVDVVSNAFELGRRSVLHHTIRDVSAKIAAARALEDAQRRLVQSQKLEAIGQLSAGIAHDFNNMLAIIQTYAEFAMESLEEDAPARSDIAEVLKASDKSAALVAKLLVFSRKPGEKTGVVKIDEVVAETCEMLGRTLEKRVEIQTRLGAPHAQVEMEFSDFEQIMMNLVINARDAMGDGNGRVTISTKSKDGEVFVVVHDDGPGMSPELCKKIFEPFFTTKDEGSGTGLGLPTVETLVHRARGRIEVDSVEGVGTSFRIRFPLEDAFDGITEVKLDEVTAVDTFEKILLAEDEAPLREAIARVLRNEGFEVRDAPNGEVAAEILEEWKCDLLISDVKMPEMNGLDLAAIARFMGYDGPILMISAHLSDFDEAAHHIMQKPFAPSELVEKIREIEAG